LVESIQIVIQESFPVQVEVVARGALPDDCTRVDQVQVERAGNDFQLTITTTHDTATSCNEVSVPFEEVIPLDVLGLDAGRYTVRVNGMTGSFTLDVDNRPLEASPTAPDNSGGTPLPVPAGGECTNSVEFVEDLSVPDDTTFAPNEPFVKGWRLRNNGTCPWTADYALTFVGGDAIPGPDTVPLPGPVAPGQTVDITVSLIAPETPGTYRANWQISDAAGELFGINGIIEDAFWVQIVVEEQVVTPLESAVIGGVIWDDACTQLEDGSPSPGCVESAAGSGFFIGDGIFSEGEAPLRGVLVTLSVNACPAEGPIPPANLIDTAVTDEDGRYRFTDLDAGVYCIAIDAFSDDNLELLIPGDWTYPAPGVGQFTVNLSAGEDRLNVDFGWDYRFD